MTQTEQTSTDVAQNPGPVEGVEPAGAAVVGAGGSTGTTARAGQGSRTGLALRIFEAWGMALLMVATIIFFSIYAKTGDTYPTVANLQNTLGSQSVLAICALGALVPLVIGGWDLSVGAVLGLSAVFVGTALTGGESLGVAIAIGVGLGALCGVVNGLLVVFARVNAVIATLGTATIIFGVVTQKTGGVSIAGNLPEGFINFGTQNTLGIPRTVFVLAVVALGVYFLLQHTPFGRSLYAMGSNPTAAELVGISTRKLTFITFVVAGTLAGAAGVLQVARTGGVDPRVGETFTLPALAAAFLSAAAVKPGRYNVGGALIAIFFLAALNAGLNLAGAAPYVTSYVNGSALILGVGLAGYLGARRDRGLA